MEAATIHNEKYAFGSLCLTAALMILSAPTPKHAKWDPNLLVTAAPLDTPPPRRPHVSHPAKLVLPNSDFLNKRSTFPNVVANDV